MLNQPVVATQLQSGGNNVTSITQGSNLTDAVTLTGQTANAGGTITVKAFSDTACSVVAATETALPNPVTGSVHTYTCLLYTSDAADE